MAGYLSSLEVKVITDGESCESPPNSDLGFTDDLSGSEYADVHIKSEPEHGSDCYEESTISYGYENETEHGDKSRKFRSSIDLPQVIINGHVMVPKTPQEIRNNFISSNTGQFQNNRNDGVGQTTLQSCKAEKGGYKKNKCIAKHKKVKRKIRFPQITVNGVVMPPLIPRKLSITQEPACFMGFASGGMQTPNYQVDTTPSQEPGPSNIRIPTSNTLSCLENVEIKEEFMY
ncbi:uncharacterized protein [Atheta coriaria]|uniref:uncharacterized protein isoform X1 n=1 Tax=Dalotia coriaria TaxID=877792 RepID=UPI0031F45547